MLQELVNEITLKSAVIQRHVQKEHQGNLAAFGRSFASDSPPHRATVLRWISESHQALPKSAKRLFELAETLDIDPFLLLDIPQSTFHSLCQHSSWITQWGKYHKSLTFLSDIVGLGVESWPADAVTEHYDSQWYHWDLEHLATDARNNSFFSLAIEPEIYYDLQDDETVACVRDNQVWYIAVRDARSENGQCVGHGIWRPFGIFFLENGQLNMMNLGTGQWLQCPMTEDRFCMEFYCGPGSGIFRVASLHTFEAEEHEAEPLQATLRYTFPE